MPSYDELMRMAGGSIDGLTEDSGGREERGASRRVGASPDGPLMHVVIWSDGSSRGNPGPGGYGTVLLYRDPAGVEHRRELSQGYKRTTNNRMELLGAIRGLESLKRPCSVEIHTDSQYVCNGFNKGWVWGWIKKGWKNSQKQPVKNDDLWKRLLAAARPHQVEWIWVKGHAGTELNERCDQLATEAADGLNGALLADEGFAG